jgi:hypothetical protein
MVYSKHDRDQLQQEIFDSLPVTRIYGAAGLMMLRQRNHLPEEVPLDLGIDDLKAFIASLDVHGLRQLRRVAKGLDLERDTLH